MYKIFKLYFTFLQSINYHTYNKRFKNIYGIFFLKEMNAWKSYY